MNINAAARTSKSPPLDSPLPTNPSPTDTKTSHAFNELIILPKAKAHPMRVEKPKAGELEKSTLRSTSHKAISTFSPSADDAANDPLHQLIILPKKTEESRKREREVEAELTRKIFSTPEGLAFLRTTSHGRDVIENDPILRSMNKIDLLNARNLAEGSNS